MGCWAVLGEPGGGFQPDPGSESGLLEYTLPAKTLSRTFKPKLNSDKQNAQDDKRRCLYNDEEFAHCRVLVCLAFDLFIMSLGGSSN